MIMISSSSASELGTTGDEDVVLNFFTFDVAFGVARATWCRDGPALLLCGSTLGDWLLLRLRFLEGEPTNGAPSDILRSLSRDIRPRTKGLILFRQVKQPYEFLRRTLLLSRRL